MTTSIKVNAHCANDKEVHIDYADNRGPQQEIIQDGEEFKTVVYDDLSCTVKEVEKAQAEPQNGDGKTRPKPDNN